MEDLYLGALSGTLERHVFEPRPVRYAKPQLQRRSARRRFRSALTAATKRRRARSAAVRRRDRRVGTGRFVQAINNNSDTA
jgi:hypothetical protein